MNETLSDSDNVASENKTNPFRYLWIGLIPIFFILLVSNLYNWQSDGKNRLDDILLQLGFIFLGLATLVTVKKKALYYTLDVIAVILLLSSMALWFFDY